MDVDVDIGKKNQSATRLKSASKNHYTNNAIIRMQRNQAEKQRRDRLNDQIAKLATIVPTVVTATKPLDKVSILRLAASWMRLNYSCLNPKHFKSSVENYLNLHNAIASNLDIIEKSIHGFIMATTLDGIILMCSKYAEDHIGYQNIDLIGHQLSDYIHEKDKKLFDKKIRNLVSKYKRGSQKKLQNIVRAHVQQRPLPRSNDVKYRKMSFTLTIHSGTTKPKEFKNRFKIGKQKDFGENAVILIFVEPTQTEPDIDVRYLDQKDCYFTVHGPQGEIIFADHRISTMTGYMPCNVLGNSAYQYIHSADVPIALFAQRAMFESTDGTGIITYRLRICDASYIYLQSKGQIRYKDSSKEIRQFICCNRLLNEEEGSRELTKFQDRFAPQLASSKCLERKKTALSSKSSSENSTFKNNNTSSLKIKEYSIGGNTSSSQNKFYDETLMRKKSNQNYAGNLEEIGNGKNFLIDLNKAKYDAQKDTEIFMDDAAVNEYHSFETLTPNAGSYNNKEVQSNCNDLLNDFDDYSNELNNKVPLTDAFSLTNVDLDFLSSVQKSLNSSSCDQLNEDMDFLETVDTDGLNINLTNSATSLQDVDNLIQIGYFKADVQYNPLNKATFSDLNPVMQLQEKNRLTNIQSLSIREAEQSLPEDFISENTFQSGSDFVSNLFASPNESALRNFELNQANTTLESTYPSKNSLTLNSVMDCTPLNVEENTYHCLQPQNDRLTNAQTTTDIEKRLDLSFLDQTVDEMSLLNDMNKYSLQNETYQTDLLKTNGATMNSSASDPYNLPNCNIFEDAAASVLNQAYIYRHSKQLLGESDAGINPNIRSTNNLTQSIYKNISIPKTCLTSVEKDVVSPNSSPKYFLENNNSQPISKASKPCLKGILNDGELSKFLVDENSNSMSNSLSLSMNEYNVLLSENNMHLQTSLYPCAQSEVTTDILPLPMYYKMNSHENALEVPFLQVNLDKAEI